ncbi:MAG: DUF924 domain-containing protein [Rhizobiales bacterium]|nr:DUF924 domain-containing protein [Hyphomicrobiales bacterium]NRB15657.1 DUF924 domain-containing protein [Hyphomicrobiales bacterium]
MDRLLDISQRAITFWRDAGAKAWFEKSDEFDAKMAGLFADDLAFLETQNLPQIFADSTAANDILGLIICLDQFRRNLNRGSGKAFAFDHQALKLSQHMVNNELHLQIDEAIRVFSYMPYMHSENIAVQQQALVLFDNNEFAVTHYDLIKAYGRFPHRNEVLGRTSTPEELEFLATDGFKG